MKICTANELLVNWGGGGKGGLLFEKMGLNYGYCHWIIPARDAAPPEIGSFLVARQRARPLLYRDGFDPRLHFRSELVLLNWRGKICDGGDFKVAGGGGTVIEFRRAGKFIYIHNGTLLPKCLGNPLFLRR